MSVSFNIVGFTDRRTEDLKERGEAIERRRELTVQPIAAKPIERPNFFARHVNDYASWVTDNQQTLVDYWNALLCDGVGPLGEDDFFLFCVIQHEREMDRMEELKRCYGSRGDQP